MTQETAHAFFMLPPRATGPRLTECLSFIQKRPRASQGAAVRSVAASPAVLPRDAEDFEVVVAMRVITGDGLELHGMMARHGEREGRAKARALLPIVVSHRCR